MANIGKSLVGVASCALFLGACGPLPEGEELDGSVPGEAEVLDDNQSEEPRRVEAQTLVGDLGSALGSPVATYPTSCTASNQWATTCRSGSSRDVSWVWKVPETATYAFSTRNSNFDTIMEIRNYKATNEVLKCNDDTGDLLTSGITLTLIKGSQLLIIVEGYEGECGNVRLNIAKR
ncbi:hypothetical protein HJC10_20270 [Corallococcus exiguus]|uniref:hypothetical protein n=1 Tax=Corallococcus TaxID=83461 RepID=UPI000EDA5386|nr:MULTISPECIES: hypothetical protein [Corallococcus]NNB89817.1 hypothetical protein [Corallococcus exiguus]NNB95662.1 hypothetical protein [Corallococcus exiguus]NNC05178.1 hypothetical protein [Corallococcus exiguus]NPC47936.1 hypothetical protein [Corallococcus exiguus]RKH79056.1 hypothetical protein D7X99_26305 [Corallococcus sp. AB032C]